METKVLILILPSFFKFSIFPSVTLILHIWTFFIKVFSETTWFRIMKSLTILSFLWKCYNLWWLPPGVCELCSLLAIFFDDFCSLSSVLKFSFKWLQCCPFIKLRLGSIGMDCVIGTSYYKGTILQRNYRKMTIPWSFSYNFFAKLHGKKIWEPQHDRVISKSML